MEVSPVYLANKQALLDDSIRIVVNQGGARSGKTYSITQLQTELGYYAENNKCEISIVSHSRPHLKRGVLRDFEDIMYKLNIYNRNNFHGTDLIYRFSPRSFIEFFSSDNGDKLRGPSRDYLFINEANLLTYDMWKQLLMRTRKKIFIDYNPVDEYHWIYDKVIPRSDAYFIQSTYLDNYDYLPPDIISELERLREEDPNYWKIYGLGQIAQATNIIYDNYEIKDFNVGGDTIYGLDFGYNNPTALLEITNVDQTIHLKQLIYDTRLTNSELIDKLKNFNIGQKFIYADSAEPDRIQEFYRAGFNIYPAEKSVKTGIDFCKRYKFIIHKESTDLIKEIRGYKWKEDKNNHILDEPLKFNDHLMDAMRYAIFTHGKDYWQLSSHIFALPRNISNSNDSYRNKLKSMRGK
jgi:phage terminase large subunit